MIKNLLNIKNHIRFQIENAVFNCRVLGNGKKSIIAFHGFGQSGDVFLSLARDNPQCTIYAIDLPFHGETTMNSPSDCLTAIQIEDLAQKLINEAGISRFSLIGFSIGAKLVFPIAQRYLSIIDHVWLLAPDGITINFWYRTLTASKLSRNIFAGILHRPKIIQNIGKVLTSLHLVGNTKMAFVLKSLNSSKKREKVFLTWNCLRLLRKDIAKLVQSLNERNIAVYLVLGEKDKIITKATTYPFLSQVKNLEVVMLPCGHESLIQNFTTKYAALLR